MHIFCSKTLFWHSDKLPKIYFRTPRHYLWFLRYQKNTIKLGGGGKTSQRNLGPSFDATLDQVLTQKNPNLGPSFDSTAYIYIYIYIYGAVTSIGGREMAKISKNPQFYSQKMATKNRHKIVAVFVAFLVSSFSMSLSLFPCFSWFPAVSWHLGTPKQPTKWGYRHIYIYTHTHTRSWAKTSLKSKRGRDREGALLRLRTCGACFPQQTAYKRSKSAQQCSGKEKHRNINAAPIGAFFFLSWNGQRRRDDNKNKMFAFEGGGLGAERENHPKTLFFTGNATTIKFWKCKFYFREKNLSWNGRLIFIHLQCWEVLPFCRFQRQRCIKILCPKDPDFYTPLPLKTAKGQHFSRPTSRSTKTLAKIWRLNPTFWLDFFFLLQVLHLQRLFVTQSAP